MVVGISKRERQYFVFHLNVKVDGDYIHLIDHDSWFRKHIKLLFDDSTHVEVESNVKRHKAISGSGDLHREFF
jgi:hypothetical protein